MAKLGDLWYDVRLVDQTDKQILDIMKKLNKMKLRVGVDDRDLRAIRSRIQNMQRPVNVRINADVSSARRQIESLQSPIESLRYAAQNIFSGFMASQFLRNLVNIGGEFEYQRKAIGAILNSEAKSYQLFDKISALAIKSPFGAMDLTKYAKQLSAYDIPYNELFDTLKKIADISAGVGVDMGRIILAYGQVRAAGFLRGTEARQFSEANIPVVSALAKKYSEIEGRLVTAGEVYDRMSERAIPFEDLHDVLMSLAEDGGRFADMQYKMSDSTKAVWKNFVDGLYQMYYEISESTSGILKGTGLALTELLSHWKDIAPAVMTAVGGYAAMRAASFAYQSAVGKEMANNTKLLAQQRAREVAMARQAKTYRNLTFEERHMLDAQRSKWKRGGTRGLDRLALSDALTNNRITRDEFLRGLHYGTFSRRQGVEMAQAGVLGLGMRDVDRAIGGTNRSMQALGRRLPIVAQGFNVVGRAVKSAFVAMRSFLAANWILLAITAIVEGIMMIVNANRAVKESADEANRSLRDAYSTSQKKFEEIKDLEFGKMKTQELKNSIQDMDVFIRDNVAGWQTILGDIYGDKSIDVVEKAERMRKVIEAYQKASKEFVDNPGLMAGAIGAAADHESLETNMKDLLESYTDFNSALLQAASDPKIKKLFQYLENPDYSAYADTERGRKGKDAVRLLSEYYKTLKDVNNETKKFQMLTEKAYEIASSHGFNPIASYNIRAGNEGRVPFLDADDYMGDYKTAVDDLRKFFNHIYTRAISQGFESGSDEMNAIFYAALQTLMGSFEGFSDDIKERIIRDATAGNFNIPITFSFNSDLLKETLSFGWQSDMIRSLNVSQAGAVAKAINGAADYAGAVEQIRKSYESAKSTLETLSTNTFLRDWDIMSKSADELDKASEKRNSTQISRYEYQDYLKQAADAKRVMEEAEAAAARYGFALGEKKKERKSDKDVVAEQWKERLALIQKADDAYRRWIQVVGKDEAVKALRNSGLFDALGSSFDFENARKIYEDALEQLKKVARTEKQRDVLKSGLEVVLKFDEDKMKEELEKAVKSLEDFISKNSSKWDLYGKIFEQTGNSDYAYIQAFETINEYWTREAEALRDTFEEMLKNNGSEYEIGDINFHETEADAEEMFGKDSALYKMWAEIKKQIEEEGINVKIETAEAINELMTAGEKVRLLRNQMEERLRGITDPKQREAITRMYEKQIGDAEFEVFKEDSGWERVFGNLDRVSLDTIDSLITLMEEYTKKTGLSVETTKELQEALEELREARNSRISPFLQISQANKNLRNWRALSKLTPDANGVVTDASGRKFTKKEIEDGMHAAMVEQYSAIERGVVFLQGINNGIAELGSLFESFGNSGLSNFATTVSSGLSGALSMGQMASQLSTLMGLGQSISQSAGTIGMAVGAAVGVAQAIVSLHDGALQEKIDESKRRVKDMEAISESLERAIEHTLGNSARVVSDEMQEVFDRVERYEAIRRGEVMPTSQDIGYDYRRALRLKRAYDEQGSYGFDLQLLKEQLGEVESQRKAEIDKTNTDKDAVQEYDDQIKELKDKIKYYWQDIGEQVYGIDFKDWASKLGDALQEAVEQGEDAWKAYKKTVGEIINDLVKQWAVTHILEPAMNNIMEKVFGEGGYLQDNGQLDEDEIMEIGRYLEGPEVQNAVGAVSDMFKLFDKYFPTDGSTGGSLDKIGSEMTEETASLLASYVNAIRADISYIRSVIGDGMLSNSEQLKTISNAQLGCLRTIVIQTERSADAAENIETLMKSITTGSKRVYIQ